MVKEWQNWNVPAIWMRVRPHSDNNRFFTSLAKIAEEKQLGWMNPSSQDGEFIFYRGHNMAWQSAVVEAATNVGMSVEGKYEDAKRKAEFSIFL